MPKAKKKVMNNDPTRPPIVTIMGHVDHGKTTLLDAIRKTNVAEGENGGITQAIGAYQVGINTKEGIKKITFIDTPGHEAFIKMRSHGAKITDIVILVVAANDGVMPQTIESIQHIKKEKVPVIVAINKMDLTDARVDRVKKQLAKNGLSVEGYGGDIVTVEISAKTGKGIQDLLEMVILTAEMNEIKADPKGNLKLAIIESKLDKRRGPVATAIVLNGTLHVRDTIELSGIKSRIRALINDKGESIENAPPSTPVEIVGLEKVAEIGESVEEIKTEDNKTIKEEENKTESKLNIILKTDVIGSLEAIELSLPKEVAIISKGTGDITESDVLLAKTNKAIIIGFNVKLYPQVETLAKTEKIRIKTYSIIYKLLDEIGEVIDILNNPEALEEIMGRAKIIAKFMTSFGEIAGSKIIEGRMARGDQVRLYREEKEVGVGKIKSIRKLKDEVPKAELGTECGILFTTLLDFQIGDMIVSVRKNE